MKATSITVPAAMFGIVLGLSGLGNDWRVATRLWGAPAWVGEAVLALAGVVWASLMLLYALKWRLRPEEARAEVAHPIQCCFIALLPVSTMLMGIALLPHLRGLAQVVLAVGAIGTLAFGLWRHGGLWRGGRSPGTTTPVLYLPTVAGNFVSAIGCGAMGHPEIGQVFLGAGILAWLALESVILHRLLTAEEMPPPLRPTLGIQLAPACVGLLAYVSVTDSGPDLLARGLVGYGLLQALLLARLAKWLLNAPLPAFWGFSFGLTALAAGVMRLAQRSGDDLFTMLSPVLFGAANLLVIGLAGVSLIALFNGKLFPPAPGATAATPPAPPADKPLPTPGSGA